MNWNNKQGGKDRKKGAQLFAAVLFVLFVFFISRQAGEPENTAGYADNISVTAPAAVTSAITEAAVPSEEAEEPPAEETVQILYYFRNDKYLQQHFEKHGDEFGYETAEQYLEGANRVIQDTAALHKLEAEDGDDVYYLEESNEFVIVSKDGYVRTYFKPDRGIEYYNRQ